MIGRILAVFIAALFLTAASAQRSDTLATREGRERVFDALVDVFRENYWNEEHLDWDLWADAYREDALSAESRAAFNSVARRMVDDIADDHSRWVGQVARYSELEEAPRPPAQPGIGFRHEYLPGTGVVTLRVYPDTPASKAGLKRGDVIVRVNGRDVRDLGAQRSAGPVFGNAIATGEVKLSVRRRNDHLNFTITPEPIRFGEVDQRPYAEMLDASTGYMYLPTFNVPNVAAEFHERLEELVLDGAKALVLDMRGNLGGRLNELGLILGAFVEGPWAQAESRSELAWESSYRLENGQGVSVLMAPDGEAVSEATLDSPTRFDGPLAVLVDAQNSSAGEVAPLVLQSLGRATIIGEPTSGNVEAIRGFDLPDGSLVMVAVANLQGLEGEEFLLGVQPDIVASSDIHELARGFDAPLAEAIRALKELPFTPGKYF